METFRLTRKLASLLLSLTLVLGSSNSARADVVREETAIISGQDFPYVYKWHDTDARPRACVVAIHGLTLHGSIYDTTAKHLVGRGFVVYAPDLRGYGRWQQIPKSHDTVASQNSNKISYPLSRSDLLALIRAAKLEHPDIPVFLVGESLGADMAIYAASQIPECVDGVVLSAPAIKRKPHPIRDTAEMMSTGFTQLPIKPYIRNFASDDPRVAKEALEDPLIRKQLGTGDLIRSLKVLGETIKFARLVPPSVPVLLMQGGQDKLVEIEAVSKLLAHLNSSDQTVKWFTGSGHLLLETSFVKQETFAALDNWLDGHTRPELPAQVSVSYELQNDIPVAKDLN
jgi:acylglycerol lipase